MANGNRIIYACCDENRRNAVVGSALNGIDYLEVLDDPSQPDADRQRTLHVYFINNIAAAFSADNIRIEGGERIRDVNVIPNPVASGKLLTVEVDTAGAAACGLIGYGLGHGFSRLENATLETNKWYEITPTLYYHLLTGF